MTGLQTTLAQLQDTWCMNKPSYGARYQLHQILLSVESFGRIFALRIADNLPNQQSRSSIVFQFFTFSKWTVLIITHIHRIYHSTNSTEDTDPPLKPLQCICVTEAFQHYRFTISLRVITTFPGLHHTIVCKVMMTGTPWQYHTHNFFIFTEILVNTLNPNIFPTK